MSKMDAYISIGFATKPHGYKGKIVVKLEADVDISNLESVFVEIQQTRIPFFIDSIAIKSQSQLIIKFKNIDTEEKANAFRNKTIWVSANWFDKYGLIEDIMNVKGFHVSDSKAGHIGFVTEIIKYPLQHILKVYDEAGNEILIPHNKAYNFSIDFKNKSISLDLPDGLLELYKKK